jgi:membrane-associated phospholipid phosphatase
LAELAELHAIEAARSPEQEADARRDGDTKNGSIFASTLGPAFDLAKLPATKALLDRVRATEKATVDRGKDAFKRPRPYIVDTTLKSCKRNDDPLSSYPSGHTSMAFSMGEVLARLVPEKAGPILARAARYGQSRIVCGQHFRSDVSAGQMLGLLIAERLMADPDFRAAFDAASKELVGAGIASTTR